MKLRISLLVLNRNSCLLKHPSRFCSSQTCLFSPFACPSVQPQMERETRIELATNSLEGCDSTTELLPQKQPQCSEQFSQLILFFVSAAAFARAIHGSQAELIQLFLILNFWS
jgi:hypothetical protein